MSHQFRYILYARKSTESDDRQILSIQSQIDELKRLAEAKGLNIVKVLTEQKSAKEPGREVFNQMIGYINEGLADGILCWAIDRLDKVRTYLLSSDNNIPKLILSEYA